MGSLIVKIKLGGQGWNTRLDLSKALKKLIGEIQNRTDLGLDVDLFSFSEYIPHQFSDEGIYCCS